MTTEVKTGTEARQAQHGGSFVIAATEPAAIFTPERLTEEHRAIRDAVAAFVDQEVGPKAKKVEAKDYATHRALMARLGQDGFLGVEVPEQWGGAGLDRATTVVVNEAMAASGSLAVTYAAHTGIGTLPLVFFGTDEQRARYLPGLADGSLIGAYALTEPAAGSDALSIKTRADRADDGGWILNGSKQFITNAGFADLFTVYAKVDGEQFTGFLVPRDTPGLTVGPEEHKMGIHGTSTCPLSFVDARLPADAVLGEIGQGHRIAFNVLNVGRFKLGAAALGGMKLALRNSVEYAGQRVAFGRPIANFPLVAAKLAEMAVRTYAVEAAIYRVAGLIDERLAALGDESAAAPEAVRKALEEYAVECSITKILGSEELDRVVDESVQVFGGYGYIEDYPAARAYRDSRINRIWEGTNEINRLLIPGTLIKRAMQGRLDLLGPAKRAQEALMAGGASEVPDGPLGPEIAALNGLRQATLLLAGAAVQRFGTALEQQQEALAALADLAIDLFAAESSVLRASAAIAAGNAKAQLHATLARLAVAERLGRAEIEARALAPSLADGDEARVLQAGIRRLLRAEPVDAIALTRQVADAVKGAGGYPL